MLCGSSPSDNAGLLRVPHPTYPDAALCVWQPFSPIQNSNAPFVGRRNSRCEQRHRPYGGLVQPLVESALTHKMYARTIAEHLYIVYVSAECLSTGATRNGSSVRERGTHGGGRRRDWLLARNR
jgi:hypothetical protein